MAKAMARAWKAIAAAAVAVCMAFSAIEMGGGLIPLKTSAATRRSSVVSSLLTSKGKISSDWEGAKTSEHFKITNNGTIFEFTPYQYPGTRFITNNAIPAGKGYTIEFDLVKTAADVKLNLSGMVTTPNNGAVQNLFISALGMDFSGDATYNATDKTAYLPDGSAPSGISQVTLEAGYRYIFSFMPSADDESKADLGFGKVAIGEDAVVQSMYKKMLIYSATEKHYGHIYAMSDSGASQVAIDNLLVKDEDDSVICDLGFDDASKVKDLSSGYFEPNDGGITAHGSVKQDTYLTFDSPAANERLVSYYPVEKDANSEDAALLKASVRLDGTTGKAGILFGMADDDTAIGSGDTSFLYFEQGEGTTKVNLQTGAETGTAQDLGVDLTKDFHEIAVAIKTDGTFGVSVDGTRKATFSGGKFEGKVGIVTDGTAGTKISLLPEFTIDSYAYVAGEGPDLENNFDSGYINRANYIPDGHLATSLGGNAGTVEIEDGVLKFNGVSDGSFFAFTGKYADFILQFDWINYAWEDRPAKEDGTVAGKQKDDNGRGKELYAPLGISVGKNDPLGPWAENYLFRLFDNLNLIQESGKGLGNVMMADSFESDHIQSGKIDFYENTVVIKLVVRNNTAKFYGGVKTREEQEPELKLIASFEENFENYSGYLSLSGGEATYCGIDNLRLTKIDGWSDEQLAAYDDYKTIETEEKPEVTKVASPALTVSGKTVSWTGVANATGYKVSVNGTAAATLGETQTSYTLDATQDGSYEVSVVALGDSSKYGSDYLYDDSDAATVTVTVGSASSGGDPSGDEPSGGEPSGEDPSGGSAAETPKKGGCSGCKKSAVAVPSVLAIAAAVALVIKRK